MSRIDHDRVMEVLAEAMDLPEPRRAGFLDSTCAGEPAVRDKVEQLLRFVPSAADVFDAALDEMACGDPDRVGPYTILEPIGEGGMATVYKARQGHPVKRTVAIKLIKLGMDTRQFVARFEAERQALAMMDHPGVAKVFDAGATETGRPYFVMEFVAGQPILQFCDEEKLNTRRRLELFTQVCDAVEHAHRRGILHRDIKNSNVLVTELDGRAIPKVIDFGVAKALQQPLTDRTLQTELGQLIGTPEYMSPEQAERGAMDVDTRSDVYSLGVLLYELIAGVQPIPSDVLRSGSYEHVQRIIRETDPPRPSTRLSSLDLQQRTQVASSRRVPLPALIRELRTELEWIPLKAMRRDRDERYRSAAELADDIRNYLDGLPLIAGPESTAYRVRKFIRRHKTGVAASAAMVLLLLGGIVATTWQAVRATRAETQAAEERDNARATLEFLTERVLSGATPERIPDANVRDQIVKAMINPAAQSVEESFKDRPLIEASIRSAIQSVLREIGRGELALPHAEAALALRRRHLGDDHPDTLSSINDYGRVLRVLGRYADAEPVYREALVRRRRVLGEDHPDTLSSLNNYAGVMDRLGRLTEAEALNREALERRRRVLGEDDPSTIMSLNNYAHALLLLGRYAESEPLYREALERRRRIQGEDHPLTLLALSNYADVLQELDRLEKAEPLSREVLARYRRMLGEDHPATLTAMSNYAHILVRVGRLTEAVALHKEVLERRRRLIGENHPDTLWSLSQYAAALKDIGRAEEAESIARESFQRHLDAFGPDHRRTLLAHSVYTFNLASVGKHAESLPVVQDLIVRCARVLGEDHRWTLDARSRYTQILLKMGRVSEAEAEIRQVVERASASASFGPRHGHTIRFAGLHAECLDALNRPEDAKAVRRQFGVPEPTTQTATQPATPPATRPATQPG